MPEPNPNPAKDQVKRMRKSSPSSRHEHPGQMRSRSKKDQKDTIAAAVQRLEELKPETPQAASLIALLRSWLTDESGYDEQTWPKLKAALNQARAEAVR